MKRYGLTLSMLVFLAALPVSPQAATTAPAATSANPAANVPTLPHFKGAPKSRKEQIDRLKATTAAFEKMTDAQWSAMQQQHEAKKAHAREMRQARMNQRRQASAGAQKPQVPAPAAATPAAPAPAAR